MRLVNVSNMFAGIKYHLHYDTPTEETKSLRAKLEARGARGQHDAARADVIFVITERHILGMTIPCLALGLVPSTGLAKTPNLDRIYIDLARRVDPALDAHASTRKRVVQAHWVNRSIELAGRLSYDIFEIKVDNTSCVAFSPVHRARPSSILSPLRWASTPESTPRVPTLKATEFWSESDLSTLNQVRQSREASSASPSPSASTTPPMAPWPFAPSSTLSRSPQKLSAQTNQSAGVVTGVQADDSTRGNQRIAAPGTATSGLLFSASSSDFSIENEGPTVHENDVSDSLGGIGISVRGTALTASLAASSEPSASPPSTPPTEAAGPCSPSLGTVQSTVRTEADRQAKPSSDVAQLVPSLGKVHQQTDLEQRSSNQNPTSPVGVFARQLLPWSIHLVDADKHKLAWIAITQAGGAVPADANSAAIIVVPEHGLRVANTDALQRLLQSVRAGRAVVSIDWVEQCFEEDRLVDLAPYRISSPSASGR